MSRFLLPFFTFCLTLVSTSSIAQLSPVDGLKKLYDDYPQEKIYMWFNKSEYVAGETVWFKIYVFSGYELSEISKTVFVELYDEKKNLISAKVYPLVSGIGQGSIDISENLQENVYYIRAYTKWMTNFDDAFQYVKPLNIYNPNSDARLISKKADWALSVHPEGNTIIDGHVTKFAVRLRSHTQLPPSWSGTLYDVNEPSNVLASFTSLDRNVSSFSFTPQAGRKYAVTVKDDQGISKNFMLPAVKASGISMQVENKADTVYCRVNFTGINSNESFTLLGEMQQQLVFHAKFNASSNVKIAIPTKEFYNGILHLTLFDQSNNPIAERLTFTNLRSLFSETDAIGSYDIPAEKRKTASIDVKIDSMGWNSYGMSVSMASLDVPTQHDNILSALWLTSDLPGNIHDPALYFAEQGTDEALDALLISEKWTRYNWFAILNNSFPVIRQIPDSYLVFTGTVSRNKKLLPSREVTFILYAPDSSSMLVLGKTDSLGKIQIDNLAFTGTVKVFYQLNEKKGNPQNIDVRFVSNISPLPFKFTLPQHGFLLAPRVSQNVPEWVTNSISVLKNEQDVNDQYKTLQEVVVRSTAKSARDKLNESLSSGIFRSQNDILFDFVNEQQNAIAYTNILQWLDGRVAGLSVEMVDGVPTPFIRGNSVSLFIDEMPISADAISSISVSDIALIKVMKGPMSFVTGGGQGGAIAIYTLKGNMRPAQSEPSLNNSELKGYDPERPFFQPHYANAAVRQPEKDVRDQLLWTTFLLPNKALTISTQKFFTNDRTGKLRIVVQGFTEKGFPVYSEKVIER